MTNTQYKYLLLAVGALVLVQMFGSLRPFPVPVVNVPEKLGANVIVQSSYTFATDSSSSMTATATTTSPILSADNLRTNAVVCYLQGTSTVFLHQVGQSTTTGVTVNTGITLGTSTQSNTCQWFTGFKGFLFGISPSPAVVTVSSWR